MLLLFDKIAPALPCVKPLVVTVIPATSGDAPSAAKDMTVAVEMALLENTPYKEAAPVVRDGVILIG